MTDRPDGPDFSHLRALHFKDLERRIAGGEVVPAEELAHLVRKRKGLAVPDAVIEHMCAHLAGEVARPRGRPRENPIETHKRNLFATALYRLLRTAGSLEEQTELAEAWLGEGHADIAPDATLAERAARIAAKLFLSGEESWRTLQNLASSQK